MTKVMVHMTGKSETRIEEALLFGDDLDELRESEDYKDFLSDDYEEEAVFEVELISGHELLPSYLCRGEG